jgi:hypothetical protein
MKFVRDVDRDIPVGLQKPAIRFARSPEIHIETKDNPVGKTELWISPGFGMHLSSEC